MVYTQDDFSFEELCMTVEEIQNHVRAKGIGRDFEDVATRVANRALHIQNAQSQYAYYVDEYLSVKEPFAWNRRRPRNDKEWQSNFRSDIGQFTAIVGYTLWAGRNTQILDKWAIQYPLSSDGPGLASDNISDYITVLSDVMNQNSDPQQRSCFLHIIQRMQGS